MSYLMRTCSISDAVYIAIDDLIIGFLEEKDNSTKERVY
jgi:hypothetical protein